MVILGNCTDTCLSEVQKKNGMEGKFIHFIQILNCEPATSAGRTATRCLAQLSCCRSSERVLGCLLGWLQQWQQGTCQSCRNGLNVQPLVQPHFFHYCARHCHVMNTWHVNIRPHLCMGLLIYKWDPSYINESLHLFKWQTFFLLVHINCICAIALTVSLTNLCAKGVENFKYFK